MIHFPVLRWGEPYQSLETEKVVHFATGEELAEVSQANGGLDGDKTMLDLVKLTVE